ncbi:MAG TPA: glycosyltransferase [Actinomycetota bacterium]|nr:glycosyltransferase [Actinomycetota bacterium]
MPATLRVLLVAPASNPSALAAARAQGWAEPFVPAQAQGFWVRAIRELGHSVEVLRWSDSLLLPERQSLAWGSLKARSGMLRRIAGKAAVELGPRNPAAGRLRARIAAAAGEADVVAISGGSGLIDASTVEAAGASGRRPVVQLNGTSPAVFGQPGERAAAAAWDHIFCNERLHALEWIGLGARAASALPVSGCDPDWHRPMPEARTADVSFVGAATPHRLAFIGRFLDALPEAVTMSLAGPGWAGFSHSRVTGVEPMVVGDALRRAICAGRITLSVQEPSMFDGGSLRNFEATACGTALVVDRLRPDWFGPDEVVVAGDPLEAADAAARLAADAAEADALAERGRLRCVSEHTYLQRWRRLLAIAMGEEEAEDPRTLLVT